MAINDTLDYTPKRNIYNYDFESDILNTIVIATLTSLILANIGSIISKLVHACEKNTFRYKAWLRAVIFASTNNPLRIFSWVRHKYDYLDPSWKRARVKRRRKRLFWPLLARTINVLAAILFIALSISVKTTQPGCGSGDYRLVWDISKAQNTSGSIATCVRIPLTSRLGEVASVCDYCYQITYHRRPPEEVGDDIWLKVGHYLDEGSLYVVLSSTNFILVTFASVQFQSLQDEDVYMFDLREHNLDAILDISAAAVQTIDEDCIIRTREEAVIEDGFRYVLSYLNCNIPAKGHSEIEYLDMIGVFLKTTAQWEKSPGPKAWIKFTGSQQEFTAECPVMVFRNRPLVHMFESMIILVIAVMLNILVSILVQRKGNAIDASYHIVKEALGFDSTTNPLEENVEQDEDLCIELRKWECTEEGEGHVGFLARGGDNSVEEFPAEMIVGGCKVAAEELAFFHGPFTAENTKDLKGRKEEVCKRV